MYMDSISIAIYRYNTGVFFFVIKLLIRHTIHFHFRVKIALSLYTKMDFVYFSFSICTIEKRNPLISSCRQHRWTGGGATCPHIHYPLYLYTHICIYRCIIVYYETRETRWFRTTPYNRISKAFSARRRAKSRGGGCGAHGKQTLLLLAVARPSWPDFYFITRHDLVQ